MLDSVLEIIRLSLALALECVKSMPDDQKAAAWARHQERMQWWEDLAKKLQGAN